MKRIAFVSGLAAVGLFSAIGFADTFTITSTGSENLSSAQIDSVACGEQDTSFTVDLQPTTGSDGQPAYNADVDDYTLHAVHVKNGPESCQGAEMTLTLLDADDNIINQVRTSQIGFNQWNGAAAWFGSYDWQQIPVGDIETVALLINGVEIQVPA